MDETKFKIPCFSMEQITKKQFIKPLDYIEINENESISRTQISPYNFDNFYVYILILP